MEDTLEQSTEEKKAQNEKIKSINVGIKTRILGTVLLFLTVFWTFLGFYDFLTFGTDITSFTLPLFICSYIVGIALIMINKRGIFHKFIVLCGVILSAFYVVMLVLYIFF